MGLQGVILCYKSYSCINYQPRTQNDVEEALAAAEIVELRRLPNPGLNIVGAKSEAA